MVNNQLLTSQTNSREQTHDSPESKTRRIWSSRKYIISLVRNCVTATGILCPYFKQDVEKLYGRLKENQE